MSDKKLQNSIHSPNSHLSFLSLHVSIDSAFEFPSDLGIQAKWIFLFKNLQIFYVT